MKEKILEMLDRFDGDVAMAAEEIYSGQKSLAIYAITVGIEKIKAQARAARRREMREDMGLQPEPPEERSRMSIGLSERAKARVIANTRRLFGADGWNIGELNIREYTKEALLEEAGRERRLSRGHVVNAQMYETLAEPMQPGQLVKDYWTPAAIEEIRKKFKEEEATV